MTRNAYAEFDAAVCEAEANRPRGLTDRDRNDIAAAVARLVRARRLGCAAQDLKPRKLPRRDARGRWTRLNSDELQGEMNF